MPDNLPVSRNETRPGAHFPSTSRRAPGISRRWNCPWKLQASLKVAYKTFEWQAPPGSFSGGQNRCILACNSRMDAALNPAGYRSGLSYSSLLTLGIPLCQSVGIRKAIAKTHPHSSMINPLSQPQ